MPKQKKKTDHYQLVAAQLTALLEQGTIPWTRGWATIPYCNARTGHQYRGLNPVLAEISVMTRGYRSSLFLGFKQAREMGFTMIKGSKATWLRLGGTGKKEERDETGEVNTKYYGFRKWIAVYNLDCFTDGGATESLDQIIERYRGEPNTEPRIAEAESLIKAQQAEIIFGGNRACYSPQTDQIHLPPYEGFSNPQAYYATAIHELSHRTGHASRLNRDLNTDKGASEYAFEELVADMSAAFVCSVLGLSPNLEHHASYLASWSKAIQNDKQVFFRAYGLAQEAADLLLKNAGLSPEN